MWFVEEAVREWQQSAAVLEWRKSAAGQTTKHSSHKFGSWLWRHRYGLAGDLSENFQMRREAADWFDREQRSGAQDVRGLKEKVLDRLVERLHSGGLADMLEASVILFPEAVQAETAEQVYNFVSLTAASFVDVLRLGEGVLVDRNLAGWGKDGLRLLSILPTTAIAARMRLAIASSRLQLMAGVPKQNVTITTNQCTTNAAARAYALVKGRVFMPVLDLWRTAGVNPPKSPIWTGAFIYEVSLALRRLRVRVTIIPRSEVTGFQDVIAAAERNPDSPVLFSSKANRGSGIGHIAHTMMASKIGGDVRIYDTTGAVYTNWQQLLSAYPGIQTYHIGIVHRSAIMSGLRLGEFGVLNALAIEVRQVPLLPDILMEAASLYTEKVALSGPLPRRPKSVPEQPADGLKSTVMQSGYGRESGSSPGLIPQTMIPECAARSYRR